MLVVSCGGGVSQEDYDALATRIDAQAAELASLQAEQAAPPQATSPAKQTDIAEISRHPTEMPDSANYTSYDNGQSSNPIARDGGPITIETHLRIREGVAEMVSGTTMDFWTFDGGIPGFMIRGRAGDTVDFYLHNPESNRLPHNVGLPRCEWAGWRSCQA